MEKIDEKTIKNIRYLSATAISNAKSGHTGIALGSAPILYTLLTKSLKASCNYPDYFNRDRVVLCSGHVAPLYYSLLHLFGYNYTMNDLKNLRKMDSICKGHPSLNPKFGIDASGGPLGQGLPMAVGMAIAETMLAKRFNKPSYNIIDHYTYCFLGEGSLMEGITSEASSLAGNLKLSKLIVLFDSNNITIEGSTDLTFTEDVLARYRAYGWNTLEVKDGEDVEEISKAIKSAKSQKEKPTIIKINTEIGKYSPLAGTNKSHGTPLTKEELIITKKNLGLDEPEFYIPDDVYKYADKIINANTEKIDKEIVKLAEYEKKFNSDYIELNRWLSDEYSQSVNFSKFKADIVDEATRKSSSKIINFLASEIPNLVSGSADLGPSVLTTIDGGGSYSAKNRLGRNIHFGVREHAMAAICNGIAIHGGIRIMCSTFMVFSDYMRHSIRMSALMKLPVTYILSHDSIAVGEDGKTHQPVEFNAMYRATPDVNFIRPASMFETVGAYSVALKDKKPTIIALSRQTVRQITSRASDVKYGAYLVRSYKSPDGIILSSGSEVAICLEAADLLEKKGIYANVVSVPSFNLFDRQSDSYKEKILPNNIRKRLAVEAGVELGWHKYVGLDGEVLMMKGFGKTGSTSDIYSRFGFTSENIANIFKNILKRK